MPPAARLGDMHTCPMVTPPPHVGGPILPPCCPTVLTGGRPQARVGDLAQCNGPPDAIVKGSPTVFVGNQMAARLGDPTAHGGVIVQGEPTVLIGDTGQGSPTGATLVPGKTMLQAANAIEQAIHDMRQLLEDKKAELEKWDAPAQANFQKYFGTTDAAARQQIMQRIDRELDLNSKLTLSNFEKANPETPGVFAYVFPNDAKHIIHLDRQFCSAPPTGTDSKAGTLVHEASHFNDIGGTQDHVYGRANAQALATTNSAQALNNADSFEYYVEGAP